MNGSTSQGVVPDWIIFVVVVAWFAIIGGGIFVLGWWIWDFIKGWFGK
jgi:hypothetical protein